MATKTTPTKSKVTINTPGVLVLQWLTYAFWGWTILALAWLTAISVGFFLSPSSSDRYQSEMVAYSLAAVIVLFVISLICDVFYSRRETLQKTGAAVVIMIIHAVIFALFGIGSLIVAVFAIVRLLIGDGDGSSYGDSGALTTLITGLTIALVYGATLLRTVRPFKLKRSGLVYWIFMAIVTVTITVLAIAGPTWNARMTRDDRLIERALPQLSEVINNHTAKADTLPRSLVEVRDEASEEARELIDRGLVEYTPGKKLTTPETNAEDMPIEVPLSKRPIAPVGDDVYSYTLCVTYKSKKGSDTYPAMHTSRYGETSPDTYYHPAGRTCYDLVTSYSGVYY